MEIRILRAAERHLKDKLHALHTRRQSFPELYHTIIGEIQVCETDLSVVKSRLYDLHRLNPIKESI